MVPSQGEYWPPIYDFEELGKTIQALIASDDFQKSFYQWNPNSGVYCQGDIVKFRSELPLIGEDGTPIAEDAVDYWMILGNTCDLERSVGEVPWSQIVPIWDLALEIQSIDTQPIPDLKNYKYYKQFYIPPWDATVVSSVHVADFLRPVTIHRLALGKATLCARLTYEAWILFHSCIVRFLARNDGREA